LQEYQMTHNMSEDEAVKLEDIPKAFIQEALYDNYRPVQPLNTRKVYSSFKIEPKKGPSKKIHWGYTGKKGPSNWHILFDNSCLGSQQSPINIEREKTIFNPDINNFIFWYDPPAPGAEFYVLNNGHTVQVNTIGPYYVANGGLSSVYSTAQFHFHWGSDDGFGSEHQIDGHSFPLELHIVNYDSVTYSSIGQAMTEAGGLAVLGVLFRIGEKDNEALEPIIQAMKVIRDPEDHAKVKVEAQAIKNFLPEDTSKFYRYNGSLTTPGCFESVIWTVFEDKLTLSARQMAEFRQLFQHRKMKGEKKKRDVSGTDRQAAKNIMAEAGIIGDVKEELKMIEALQKKKQIHIPKMMQDEGYKTQNETQSKPAENVEEITIEIIQEQLVDNYRPVQPVNNRLVYRTFSFEPRREIRYVVRSESQGNFAASSVPSFIVILTCFLLSVFSLRR
ncbi:putative carbonic anhydrase 3, partial [Saccostrea cucullata]|uniref:putative carbonic anhydrase 3 n=1 Tax=Saccostrea cuccullata TaxID=36930 RepID=UPI002ED2319E